MSRTIGATTTTALASGGFTVVNLFYLGFSVGSPLAPIVLTSAQFPVTYDYIYLPSKHIIAVGSVSEDEDIRVGTWTLTLSAAEQTYVSLFLSTDYIDVVVRYYKAVIDSSYQIVGSPQEVISMFEGQISGFKIDESGSNSKLVIEAASHWANFDVINGRKTNQNSQQAHFSTDLGFEFASHNVKNILWGRET